MKDNLYLMLLQGVVGQLSIRVTLPRCSHGHDRVPWKHLRVKYMQIKTSDLMSIWDSQILFVIDKFGLVDRSWHKQ